jgi:hypothetical protein
VEQKQRCERTDVFVLDVFEKLELAIGAFGEDRRAEGFHYLLDGNGCACELVFRGTKQERWTYGVEIGQGWLYHTSPKAPVEVPCQVRRRGRIEDAPMPTGWRSTYLVVT